MSLGRGRRIYNGKLSQIFINFLRERSPSKWNDPFGHGPGIWGWQQSGSWWQKAESSNGVVAEGAQFAPAPILLLVPTYLQLGGCRLAIFTQQPASWQGGAAEPAGLIQNLLLNEIHHVHCTLSCAFHSFIKEGMNCACKVFCQNLLPSRFGKFDFPKQLILRDDRLD